MTALIIMNAQNDMFNGTLPVHDAASVIPIIDKLADSNEFDIIVWVRTIYPYHHCSFSEYNEAPVYSRVMCGGNDITVLPPHCVWNSVGGRNMDGFKRVFSDWDVVIGRDDNYTSYSAMDGEVRIEAWPTHKTLVEHLNESKIYNLTVCGFLTEFGVAETVADARKRGFAAKAELSACRGLIPGTIPCHQNVEQAEASLRAAFETRMAARKAVIAYIESRGHLFCACEECLKPKIDAALAL